MHHHLLKSFDLCSDSCLLVGDCLGVTGMVKIKCCGSLRGPVAEMLQVPKWVVGQETMVGQEGSWVPGRELHGG